MYDDAHLRTDGILTRIGQRLRRLQRQAYHGMEIDWSSLLSGEENATQKQRLAFAKKDRKLAAAYRRIEDALLDQNKAGMETITRALDAVYRLNFAAVAERVNPALKRPVRMPKHISPGAMLSRLDRRALRRLLQRRQLARRVHKAIAPGIKRGEGVTQLQKRVINLARMEKNRAMTIARTEVTRIENRARMDAWKKVAAQGKRVIKTWMAVLDGKTRDSHAFLNGETVPLDARFSNGLMYPCDPAGSAAETCNCRCWMKGKVAG